MTDDVAVRSSVGSIETVMETSASERLPATFVNMPSCVESEPAVMSRMMASASETDAARPLEALRRWLTEASWPPMPKTLPAMPRCFQGASRTSRCREARCARLDSLIVELWRSASMGETRAARKAGIHTLTSTVSAVRAMAKSTTRQSTIR